MSGSKSLDDLVDELADACREEVKRKRNANSVPAALISSVTSFLKAAEALKGKGSRGQHEDAMGKMLEGAPQEIKDKMAEILARYGSGGKA